jgi:nitrogen fixation/metabolism regulation signal transduction histidine kinase
MLVSCKKCEKKYKLNIEKITGPKAVFTCRICNQSNVVIKPLPANDLPPNHFIKKTSVSKSRAVSTSKSGAVKDRSQTKTSRLGSIEDVSFSLRNKMIIFFILIPVAMLAAVSFFYISQILSLSGLITDESSKIVAEMAESVIADKARSVARDVQLYLETHPGFKREDFSQDPVFKEIATKKVGQTGYTCLAERPNPIQSVHTLWVHPIQKLIGVNIDAAMGKKLGNNYQRWYDITANAFKGDGQEATGYYMWYDKREKYMAMAPVKGTNYFIASTTYLDEFTAPVKTLQKQADNITRITFHAAFVFLTIAAILIAAISLFCANKISGNIRYLTDVASKISVGDLNVKVHLKTKDELGVLASAIGAMQASIRISLERMRRKRKAYS